MNIQIDPNTTLTVTISTSSATKDEEMRKMKEKMEQMEKELLHYKSRTADLEMEIQARMDREEINYYAREYELDHLEKIKKVFFIFAKAGIMI